MNPTHRPWAWRVLVGGVVVFVLVVWWRVSWQPVPGGPPPPARAVDLFGAAEIARAEHNAYWTRVWSWTSLALSLATVLLAARSARLRDWLGRGRWWLRAVAGVVILSALTTAVTLPTGLALWALRRRAGLSTQSWPSYLVDDLRGLLVNVVVTSIPLLVLITLARRRSRDWPLAAGLAAAGLVVAGSTVYPLTVEPFFNSFRSLPAGELRSGVFAIAEKDGVAIDDVLVVDASRRTTSLNAYVSGLAGTRRVVLYDTLVADLPTDQALSVVAHEVAHAKRGDVLTGTLLGASGIFAGVGLLGLLVRRRPDSASAVPVLIALVTIGTLVAAPLQNGLSRRIETRADVDALTATGDAEAFVAMQQRLARRSLADPTPPAWSHWWFGSHPTTLQRIAIAQQFAAQQLSGRQFEDH